MDEFYGKSNSFKAAQRPQAKAFEDDGFSMDEFYGKTNKTTNKGNQPAFIDEGVSYNDFVRGGVSS